MTDAERIRAAIDCAHPVTGEDHDAVDGAHVALDRLVAESERLREKALSLETGLAIKERELARVRTRADANRTEKHHLEAALREIEMLPHYGAWAGDGLLDAILKVAREALGSGREGTNQ